MLASQVEQQQGDDEKKPLSISEALDAAKGSLEKLKLRVLGEVSEVNVKPGYANAYFTLKDETRHAAPARCGTIDSRNAASRSKWA